MNILDTLKSKFGSIKDLMSKIAVLNDNDPYGLKRSIMIGNHLVTFHDGAYDYLKGMFPGMSFNEYFTIIEDQLTREYAFNSGHIIIYPAHCRGSIYIDDIKLYDSCYKETDYVYCSQQCWLIDKFTLNTKIIEQSHPILVKDSIYKLEQLVKYNDKFKVIPSFEFERMKSFCLNFAYSKLKKYPNNLLT